MAFTCSLLGGTEKNVTEETLARVTVDSRVPHQTERVGAEFEGRFEHPETEAKAVGKGYTSYDPPKRYLRYPSMPVETRAVTIKQAQKICGGHWGCQWFE